MSAILGEDQKRCRADDGGTEEHKEQKQQQNYATAEDVLVELARLGVGEPTQSELARLPGMSADTLHEALRLAGADRDGVPAGVVVKAVREKLPGAVKVVAGREEQQVQQAAREAHERAEREEETKRLDVEYEGYARIIAAATDAELTAAHEQVVAIAALFLAERWKCENPRDATQPLQVELARTLQENGGNMIRPAVVRGEPVNRG